MTNHQPQTPTAIVGLRAHTSIHAGAGQRTSVIDLPIQREGHNGWPCIFGSSVKGALRTRAEQAKSASLKQNQVVVSADNYKEDVQLAPEIAVIFGPPPSHGASEHAGALMVTDARLLLYPVRSLTSQFKWVTCPEAIRRYLSDRSRLHLLVDHEELDSVLGAGFSSEETALVHHGEGDSKQDDLFLEEYRFNTQPVNMDGLIALLLPLMANENSAEDKTQVRTSLERQLVVVSDDMFAYIVGHGTPVNPHISIDSLTKTVKDGALWYEETLPPETLLYIGLGAGDARGKRNAESAPNLNNAGQILQCVLDLFTTHPWLQIGGNETLGMGWCSTHIVTEGD